MASLRSSIVDFTQELHNRFVLIFVLLFKGDEFLGYHRFIQEKEEEII